VVPSCFKKEKKKMMMKKKVTMLLVAALFVGICRAGAGQDAPDADRKMMTRDELQIAVQEICPVSGQKLGAMGAPVKARIGEEQIFLCCQGCAKSKVKAEHWATIHANFAKAQARCPVMDRPLPTSPKWTIVDGRIVFVCCPPCIEKIEADPKAYLQKVDALYMASLRAKESRK
jgi:hypothetical protein